VPASALTLRTHERFHSRFLPDDRDIIVYLPPGYDRDPAARYPVLYLHDGQNLFDPETAFERGHHWHVGETANALIDSHRLPPLIIVGIANTGARRLYEYTHTHDRRRGGGDADDYGRLIIEELKPFIDDTYQTRTDAASTGLGGSSLGGLVTLYLGLLRPDVFSKLAVLSPSVWWDRRSVLRTVRDRGQAGFGETARPRIWVDMGTAEGRYHLENTRLLRAGLLKAGWQDGDSLHYEEVPDGTHSERSWAARFGRVLEWLWAEHAR
jgi:predicted alpha/beta superfamily hydrolase